MQPRRTEPSCGSRSMGTLGPAYPAAGESRFSKLMLFLGCISVCTEKALLTVWDDEQACGCQGWGGEQGEGNRQRALGQRRFP